MRRRGVSNVLALVTGLVTVAVVMIVGVLIFGQVSDALPRPSNTELNATVDKVISTTTTAFNLLPVLLIIMVAGALIAVIATFAGGGGGRQ